MQYRRRFKQTLSLQARLVKYAADLRNQADAAHSPADRDRLVNEARRAETAAHMADWLRSPGLRSPT